MTPAAKILALLLRLSRSAYVSAAQIGGVGGPGQALMRAIMKSKIFQPSASSQALKQIGKMTSKGDMTAFVKALSKSKIGK